MSRRKTPAARALVGALALSDGDTSTNAAFRLAGYELKAASPVRFHRGKCLDASSDERCVTRAGRIVFVSRNAYTASEWLSRLGSKLEALGVGKAAA